MYDINNPNKEIEPYDENKQYISLHMGKIVKRYKCIKTKDILKHIINIIPQVIDKYIAYVEDTDTPEQMKQKLSQILHNCLLAT